MKKLLAFILLSVLALAQSPQTQTSTNFAVNASWANGIAIGYAPTKGSGLTLNIGKGTTNCSGTLVEYAGGTLTMTDNTTNYVYLNSASSCAPASSTSAFTAANIWLHKVTTSGGVITAIDDVRTPFVSPGTGVAAGVTSVTCGTGLTGGTITSTGTCAIASPQNTRTCTISNDTQSSTALTAAQISGDCIISGAATIIEVDVVGGTGTTTGSAAAPTVTGTSSVQIGKYTPSTGSSTTSLMSAALAASSGKACALPTAGSATCGIMGITQAGSSLSISTTALAKGDVLYVSAATVDGTQTWYTISIHYTVN